MRRLQGSDAFLLRVATWLNLNWSRQRFTFADMDADPRLAAYYRSVPAFGFVSISGGEPTGVVWVTHFSDEAPGYGFVRADVPELSVCVLPGYRGTGLGNSLIAASVAEAQRRSLGALSLSVEEGNPARRLYERHGFAPELTAAAHPGTLLLRLDGPPS